MPSSATLSTRRKLLNAHRLLLAEISLEGDHRAECEVLVGRVYWNKAAAFQAQDDESYGVPSLRGADMIMTAESGYLAEVAGGRDLKAELRWALEAAERG